MQSSSSSTANDETSLSYSLFSSFPPPKFSLSFLQQQKQREPCSTESAGVPTVTLVDQVQSAAAHCPDVPTNCEFLQSLVAAVDIMVGNLSMLLSM